LLRDAGDDLHLVFRDRIEQEESAEKYYKEVTAKYGDFRVIQTGHSLGGYLAQSVAAKHNVPTVTFNAPGKKHNSRPDLEFANRNGLLDDLIHNYVIRDDIPGNVNIHLGKTYLLNTPSEQRNIASRNDYAEAPGLLKNLKENSLKNHSIAHFSGIHGGKFSKKYAHFRKYYDQNGYIVPRNSIKEIRAP
jgi:hypothetical protein